MRLSTLLLVLAALAAVVTGGLLLRPAPDSPDRQVRAAVEAMARAAREHDPAGVLDHISEGLHLARARGEARAAGLPAR